MRVMIAAALVGLTCATAVVMKWDDWVTVPKLRASIDRSLKDPFSAAYQDVHVRGAGTVLCGRVNAKNSHGAFAGFSRFISTPDRYIIEGESTSSWGELSTEEVIQDLDVANGFLRVNPGADNAAMAAHVRATRFKLIWDRYCEIS